MGTWRVLRDERSGRGFLQNWAMSGDPAVEVGHFFETLKSKRRLGLRGYRHAPVAQLETSGRDLLPEFITNHMKIRPGVLAWLYLRRWDIEKTLRHLQKQALREKGLGQFHDRQAHAGAVPLPRP